MNLKYDDYIKLKDAVVEGFIEAAKFLEEESLTTKKYFGSAVSCYRYDN